MLVKELARIFFWARGVRSQGFENCSIIIIIIIIFIDLNCASLSATLDHFFLIFRILRSSFPIQFAFLFEDLGKQKANWKYKLMVWLFRF